MLHLHAWTCKCKLLCTCTLPHIIHACIYPVYTYMHICAYVYLHTYICAESHTYIHAYKQVYIHTCMYAYVHVHVCRHSCIHACIHLCMHACMHMFLHTYIRHAYIPAYTTYVHKYIHSRCNTHTCKNASICVRLYIHAYVARWMLTFTHVNGACKHAWQGILTAVNMYRQTETHASSCRHIWPKCHITSASNQAKVIQTI